jgi:hypothetical protein
MLVVSVWHVAQGGAHLHTQKHSFAKASNHVKFAMLNVEPVARM